MKMWRRGLVGLAGFVALGVGAVSVWAWANPAAMLLSAQRWQIDSALGAPVAVEGPRGAVQVWRVTPSQRESRPTVVLVHGFGDSGAGWVPVASELGTEVPVVVLDMPGHGRSDPAAPPLTLDDLVAGLDAVLATVDGPVRLVGNSLGGWVCASWVERHPDDASRVVEMVWVNSAGLHQTFDLSVLLPSTREGVVTKNAIVLGEQAPTLPGFVLDGLAELHQDPRLMPLFHDLMAGDKTVEPSLAELPVPVRFVWGTPDAFFPVEGYLDRAQALRPEAPLHTLEGCGHSPQYSCPEALVRVLRSGEGRHAW